MISIIIRVYNREKFLEQAILSVLNQSYTRFNLFICDDGSIDNSVNIALTFAKIDNRVQVLQATHQGAAKILASGIALSNSKYIAWVDSDDWLHPKALELMLPIIENDPSLGVIYSDYMAVNEDEKEIGISRSAKIPYSSNRLLLDMMCHHFQIIRRSIYNKVGGVDTNFACNHDYDLLLKISEIATMQHFPQILYYRRMHKNSITGSRRKEQIQYSRIAVEQALNRRGLEKSLLVNVCPNTGKVQLQIKT